MRGVGAGDSDTGWVPIAAILLVAVLTVVAAGAAGATATATGVDADQRGTVETKPQSVAQGAVGVGSCRVISTPGRYVLTSNLTAGETCIEVTASDVTVDGDGHSITSTTSVSNVGIHVNGTAGARENVTVTDVHLRNWHWSAFGKVAHAVRFTDTVDGRVTLVNVTAGDHGIALRNVSATEVVGNTLWKTRKTGVSIRRNSGYNRVVYNTFVDTDQHAVWITSSRNTNVNRNELRGASGMLVASGSADTTVTDNRLYRPGGTGIEVRFSPRSRVTDNVVVGSSRTGIDLNHAGTDAVVTGNVVNASLVHGIRVSRGDGPLVANNSVYGTEKYSDVLVRWSSNATIRNNLASSEGVVKTGRQFGIHVRGGSGVTVADNRVRNHEHGGIEVDGTANSTISNNTVENVPTDVSFPTGIALVRGATNNTLRGNTVRSVGVAVNVSDSDGNSFERTRIEALNGTLWAFGVFDATGTDVRDLDVGDSTAPNTTVSFTGENVTLTPVETAPTLPAGMYSVGRYVRVRNVSDGAWLHLSMHYTALDIAAPAVDEPTLRLWVTDGTWREVATANRVDTAENEVSANLTTAVNGTVAPLDSSLPGPGDLTGDGQRAVDLDGDGLYEDLDGDGRVDLLDVQVLYSRRGSTDLRSYPSAFDFNGDGTLDLLDVQALYVEVR